MPADFGLLVQRAFVELERQRQIFDLPERKFYRPRPGFDLAVQFHGQPAANGLGPAAGPQSQMAQNIVLAWLAGARIIELKTVQLNDRLHIPRPCIDVATVGYNVEWSQELRLEQSLREYVGAHMLIEMLRASGVLDGPFDDDAFAHADVRFDLSVGYDLKGIHSPRMVDFVRSMQDASPIIEELRARIPERFRALRQLDFEPHIVRSVTLSTFHGCPPDEIERTAEFLLRELGLHVTVKLNPTLLGYEACAELLHGVLGYDTVRMSRPHFDSDLQFDALPGLVSRLQATARATGCSFGLKLSNNLVVHNDRKVFSDDIMYLSGAPLHVLALSLLERVRGALGPELPLSFSAGIDAQNFARAVSCNLVPVTTCTDLLRPGGYGRLPAYLANLENEMERLAVRCPGDFVLRVEGQGEPCVGLAVQELRAAMEHAITTAGVDAERQERLQTEVQRFASTLERRLAEAVRGSPFQDVRAALGAVWRTRADALRSLLRPGREAADQEALYQRMVELAAARNVPAVVARAAADPRYAAARHTKPPRKIGSRLVLFDCISCDKCIPVCPNDANFVFDVEPQDFDYVDYRWDAGRLQEIPGGRFTVTRTHQIANYADFCNECGNCDVFCPEDGGPFIEKPRFFSSIESWQRDRGVGFYVRPGKRDSIWGRFAGGREYLLQLDQARDEALFKGGDLELEIDLRTHRVRGLRGAPPAGAVAPHVDMLPYHVLRTLLGGVLDGRRTNYVSALRP